jgi:hypothetical protein
MTRITFKHTGNVYLNAGIVGIAVTLTNYDLWRQNVTPALPPLGLERDRDWGFEGNSLWIEAEEPLELLNRLYMVMGHRYYNSSTKDALDKMTNYWYEPETDEFHAFPKMKTYGFGALLTNDAAGKTPNEANTIRRKAIKEDDAFGQLLLRRYTEHFEEKGLKLGQQLYVNEPYAKITRLKLTEADLEPGKNICPLTGEGFKRLQSADCVSPTTAGLTNFMSNLSRKGDKIGWKALYAVRFAPVLALYRYVGGLDTLYCYFYDHPRLGSLFNIYGQVQNKVYLEAGAKQEANHLNNINLAALSLGGRKGAQLKGGDFVHPNEVLFQLIYTFSQALYDVATDRSGKLKYAEDEEHINLYLLRADKFAGTMRPNTFTAFNHFAYVRRYIVAAERAGIDWGQVLASLRIHLPGKERDWAKERLPREAVLKRLMVGQTFVAELKAIYLGGFAHLLTGNNKDLGYKRWDQLTKLLKFNEFGPMNNHPQEEKDFHELAYKLGTQIGMAIMDSGDGGSSPREVAKSGRKYIIDLDKSRTYEDFLEAIKRIQLRYERSVSRELFVNRIDDTNFRKAKLLATIGALNVLNSNLSSKSSTPENA